MKKFLILLSLSTATLFIIVSLSVAALLKPSTAYTAAGYPDSPQSPRSLEQTSGAGSVISWVFEAVDEGNSFIIYNDSWLKLDNDGHPHLAFGGSHLTYAEFDGNDWNLEIVDEGPSIGAGAALVLDSVGQPHIAYVDGNQELIKYASRTGDQWHIEIVGETHNWAQYQGISIAIDSTDRPGIVYFAYTDEPVQDNARPGSDSLKDITISPTPGVLGLSLARPNGDGWVAQFVDDGNVWFPSLTFDASDRPLIAYTDRSDSQIILAQWLGAGWDYEVVFSVSDSYDKDVYYPSLVIDQSQQAHVAFIFEDNDDYSASNYYVEHAIRIGGVWSVEEISPTHSYSGLAMTLDSQDRPHIITPGLLLMYDGQAWSSEELDNGSYSAIALDSSDNPKICYLRRAEPDDAYSVFYSYKHGDNWSTEIVDQLSNRTISNLSLDLAIGGDQSIHTSYFDSSSHQLLHAKKISDTWEHQNVALAHWNATSSMDLDSLNQPSVAYLAHHNGPKVDLAQWTGTEWLTETIDATSDDWPVNLSLDSQDRPHVSYGADKYAAWNGSSWDLRVLDAFNISEHWMALDHQDRAHFIFRAHHQDTGQPYIGYGTWDGDGWQSETVLEGIHAVSMKLVIDQDNNPHLIYHDNSSGDLVYGLNEGEGWVFDTIDTIYATLETDLAIDGQGKPHLIYHSRIYYAYLYHGYKEVDGWHIQKVWKTKTSRAALELDHYNRPVIAHYNFPGGGIYLAKGPDLTQQIALPVILH